MNYNYHTHTYRCGHATGKPEEYIKRALECGIEYMGFSDHIPFRFPDGFESPGIRVPTSEGKAYCSQLKRLRRKYRDKIEISIGFESEYYPEYFDEMLRNAKGYGAEYLILGIHFIAPEITGDRHTFHETKNERRLKKYADTAIAAMETGAFTYVAHPDILNFRGSPNSYREEMRRICVASRELNIPLEINFLGIRGERYYPRGEFWQIAGEEKAPVTFGFDAHSVHSAYDGESLLVAEEMVKEYDLNYIGKPELRLI